MARAAEKICGRSLFRFSGWVGGNRFSDLVARAAEKILGNRFSDLVARATENMLPNRFSDLVAGLEEIVFSDLVALAAEKILGRSFFRSSGPRSGENFG